MNILINASNLRKGGGIQVAESLLRELYKFPQHRFVVVYSTALNECVNSIEEKELNQWVLYDLSPSLYLDITGRNIFLDNIVKEEEIDAALTIFGPSRWRPRVPHVCGFARAHMVLGDSPYWKQIGMRGRIKYYFRKSLLKIAFERSAKALWSESSYISELLNNTYPSKRTYTITNNYNQIFDQPSKWDKTKAIPPSAGLTLLTVAANYPHKNLSIIIPTVHYLVSNYPEVQFRFVLTINENDYLVQDDVVRKHLVFLGPVTIAQCPYLYEQCDIMFLPSLLECFSANYAEAMRMRRPILTTNLSFAKALCGDAAFYYEATDPCSLGDAIILLSQNSNLRSQLVEIGSKQLLQFDTYELRAKKLIDTVETEFNIQSYGEA